MKYVYTAWLRDTSVAQDDPDYEWPACFVIEAADEAAAKAWGDRLAERYAADGANAFLRSTLERLDSTSLPGVDGLPVIADGQEASDEEIGW